jgi:hypothetical protein
MERVLGPVDGYYAAIFARELNGSFRASYKVCAIAPADYGSARPVRHKRVDGLFDTSAQAFDIAEQLARLQIARLRDEREWAGANRRPAMLALDFDTSLGDEPQAGGTGRLYAPTEPAPL